MTHEVDDLPLPSSSSSTCSQSSAVRRSRPSSPPPRSPRPDANEGRRFQPVDRRRQHRRRGRTAAATSPPSWRPAIDPSGCAPPPRPRRRRPNPRATMTVAASAATAFVLAVAAGRPPPPVAAAAFWGGVPAVPPPRGRGMLGNGVMDGGHCARPPTMPRDVATLGAAAVAAAGIAPADATGAAGTRARAAVVTASTLTSMSTTSTHSPAPGPEESPGGSASGDDGDRGAGGRRRAERHGGRDAAIRDPSSDGEGDGVGEEKERIREEKERMRIKPGKKADYSSPPEKLSRATHAHPQRNKAARAIRMASRGPPGVVPPGPGRLPGEQGARRRRGTGGPSIPVVPDGGGDADGRVERPRGGPAGAGGATAAASSPRGQPAAISPPAAAAATPGSGTTARLSLRADVRETGRDALGVYLKGIGNHDLLTAEDEAVLGGQVRILVGWERKRRRLKEELQRSPTYAEWADALVETVPSLKSQIRKSRRARAAMVESNLRLVVSIARQVTRSRTGNGNGNVGGGVDLMDACQYGIIGLTRACERFDPDRGFRFSTYATWFIQRAVRDGVDAQRRTIRLPDHVMRRINSVRIAEVSLRDELGRRPTDEEVAGHLGMSVEKLNFYRRAAEDALSFDRQLVARKGKGSNASGGGGGDGRTLRDLLRDPGDTPADVAERGMLKHDVRRLVGTLSPREQAVIRLRFGLDDGQPRTLEYIGDQFSVPIERVRKLEARALLKLRQPYRNQSVQGYLSDCT